MGLLWPDLMKPEGETIMISSNWKTILIQGIGFDVMINFIISIESVAISFYCQTLMRVDSSPYVCHGVREALNALMILLFFCYKNIDKY